MHFPSIIIQTSIHPYIRPAMTVKQFTKSLKEPTMLENGGIHAFADYCPDYPEDKMQQANYLYNSIIIPNEANVLNEIAKTVREQNKATFLNDPKTVYQECLEWLKGKGYDWTISEIMDYLGLITIKISQTERTFITIVSIGDTTQTTTNQKTGSDTFDNRTSHSFAREVINQYMKKFGVNL